MNILALDPATKCGWAHSMGAGGTFDLTVRRDESKGMRLIRLKGKLNKLAQDAGIDLVVFEAARNCAPKMQGALVVQAQFQSVIIVWCEEQTPKVEYRGYSPKEIKAHACTGKATKAQMIASAKSKWPEQEIQDDNHADALWLLDLAKKEYDK